MRTVIPFLMAVGMVQASLRAQLPVITNQPASRAVWIGGNVSFAAGVSGAGPLTYQWQLNGTNLPNGIIATLAGNGTATYSGDGGPVTNASLQVSSVALNSSGDLFVADTGNNRIRKLSANGLITSVAGNGNYGFSGDGGAAATASLSKPLDAAVDASGNLFIADDFNGRIRKVDTNGIITTVAGGGANYFGDGGPATNTSLHYPSCVVVDGPGNLFIADYGNNRIRKVTTNGIITTVAGNGGQGYSGDGGQATNASLDDPFGIAVDASGELFIADYANNRIRKVTTNGIITTVAGNGSSYTITNGQLINGFGDGGPATNANLSGPSGVVLDALGNLVIADTRDNRIRRVATNGIITTVAGNGMYGYSGAGGAATNALLYAPNTMVGDDTGNLFIADTQNNRLRKVTNTQGPTLALNYVTPGIAGSYQVVVTGPGGSVTSSVATLTVATAPLIYQTVPHPDGSVTLYFVSQPDSTNVVLSATNLSPPVLWQPLSTNVAGGDGDWQYTDTNAASWQARFYKSFAP